MEAINANLDKICAEYGMDLLNLPKELYENANKLIKSSSDLQDFKTKNYDESQMGNSLKEFLNYKLINPLSLTQKSIKNDNDFNKKKTSDTPLKFDSKNYETEITKALGILVEDGPFAYMIWLKSQDKEPHRAMLIQTARVLARLNVIKQINPTEDLKKEIEDEFLKASGDLTKSIFIKTILEKMLVYARYKAKAMQNE